MKKVILNYLLFFTLLFTFIDGNASTDLAAVANGNIKSFIQTWGLIKYRSPNGVAGQFKADQAFLSLIDQVIAADQNQLNQLLVQLLEANPGMPVNIKNENKDLIQNLDYRWIKDKKFDPQIRQQLWALMQTNNTTGQHYYIPKIAHEAEIPNEEAYTDYKFDKEAMNLLTLAKAWNAVAYLFPYKYVMDQKWEQTLVEMVPLFRAIHSRTSYEKSVLLLESALDDTHAAGFLDQLKTSSEIFKLQFYPPFDYQIYQHQILVKTFFSDSLSNTSQLKSGDLIVKINGVKTKEWLVKRSVALPASNQSVKYRLLSKDNGFNALAFGQVNEGKLNVRVRRGEKYMDLNLVLLDRQNASAIKIINTYFRKKYVAEQFIKGYEELDNNVALIRSGYFFDKDLPEDKDMEAFTKNLHAKKAIIFDMRKYPAAPGLFYYFLPTALGKSAFEFAQYFVADLSNPGVFKRQSAIEIFLSKDIKPEVSLYKGKIVILTNEYTQSMGEWYSMMLSQINPNTTIIGSQTAGADGDLKRLSIPGGYQFLFTGNGIFYLNGKETQRKGIVPDIPFRTSLNELLSPSIDAQLDKAIQYINVHQ